MLYKKCELSGQTFASAFQIQSTTTAYSHPDKKEGRYPMPQSGRLSTAFSLAWRDDGEDMWGYARAVYLTPGGNVKVWQGFFLPTASYSACHGC